MKKSFSLFLSILLALSLIITPNFVKAEDVEVTDSSVVSITNTYEETDLATINSALLGSDTFIKNYATANSTVAQFEQVYMPNAANAAGVKIYDPNDADFSAFAPEKNTYYRITFDYYFARATTTDLELSIYGNIGENSFKDNKLASAVYIAKGDTNYSTNPTKYTATVYFNTDDAEYKSLSIIAELVNHTSDTADRWGRLDNVVLTECPEVITNTYDDGVSNTNQPKLFGANTKVVTKAASAAGGNTTNVVDFQQVYGSESSTPDAVRIYDQTDSNFTAFVPEKNTTYKITFDYYARLNTKYNLEYNIYGNTDSASFKGTKLANAVLIVANDSAYNSSAWREATVYISTGDNEYKSLSIVPEYIGTADMVNQWIRLDNVVMTKVDPDIIVNDYEEYGIANKTLYSGMNQVNVISDSNNDTVAVQFKGTAGSLGTDATAVKIYNNFDNSYPTFIPEKNSVYKITFRHYARCSTVYDLEYSIYGNTDADTFRGDKLSTALIIEKNDENYTDMIWRETTAYFYTGEKEYSSISLDVSFVGLDETSSGLWICVDDITLEKANMFGDINSDAKVDIRDLVRLRLDVTEGALSLDITDLNKDGKLNAQDLTILRQILLGIYSDVTVNSLSGVGGVTADNGASFCDLRTAFEVVADGGTVNIEGEYKVSAFNELDSFGKKITLTGGTIDFSSLGTVILYGDFTFDNITIVWNDGSSVYANGNNVSINENVTVIGTPAAIYGGACNTDVNSTNLRILSGNYKEIYGGSNGFNVNGDTNLYVGGNANSNADETSHDSDYVIFGGSNNGTVNGNTNLILAGGKANYAIGGGKGSNSQVVKTCNTTLSGMRLMSIYGGSRGGGVVYNTNVSMTDGWVQQIFGGSENSGVTGETNVNLTGGTVVRRIYGGCYNEWKLSYSTAYYVTGNTKVTLGGSINYLGNYSDGLSSDNGISAGSRYNNTSEEISTLYIETQELYNSVKSKIGGGVGYKYDNLYIAGVKQ